MQNPWQQMSLEEARAYDERKETGPRRIEVAAKRRVLWDLIRQHLPRDGSVPILDLGGGTGIWSIPLAQAGYDVVLADISPGFLARAKEKLDALDLAGKVTLVEMDICDLGRFADGYFHLVLALGDPLSYCADAEDALRRIRRVTAPDGILIGDVENRYSGDYERRAETWEDIEVVLKNGTAYWAGSHHHSPIRMFTADELQSLAQTTGWEVAGMYPSDLLANILSAEIKGKLLSSGDASEEVISRWANLEEHMRRDRHLLGAGYEIQFVARNAGCRCHEENT